jgi:hypothetical protein
VLVPACEHPKENIAVNGDLLLEPFKNKIFKSVYLQQPKINVW